MKKRNLLSLGALVLSLGLTVTSCAGAQGDKGDKGDKGDTGAKGDKGDKGADGKTYIAVIVDSWNFPNVKVTQDKYFVEPGETVTFTFEAASGQTTGEVLSSVEFNGDEYLTSYVQADNNGKATLEVKTTSADKGYQMTFARFSSAESYGQSLLEDYFDEIADSDKLVIEGSSSSEEYAETKKNITYKTNSMADFSTFAALEAAKSAVSSAINDLGANPTIAKKVEAVLASVAEGKAAIKKAYDDKVAATKTSAKSAINGDTKTNADYKDADFATDKANAISAIEAATTLEGIAKVALPTAVSKDTTKHISASSKGSYYSLSDNKDSVIGALYKALTDTIGSVDTWMNPGTDSDKLKMLESMKEKLATYGVTISSLPSEVYASWASKVSSATSLTWNSSKSKYQEEIDGTKEIQESYTGIKTELAEAIKQSYFKEINDSKVLADATDSKSALRAVVETTVSNFVSADTDLNTYPVSGYLSETAFTVNSNNDTKGLIKQVEEALNKAIVDNGNTSFANERMDNAIADAKSQLLEKAKSYRTKDALYGKVFGEAYFNSSATENVPTSYNTVATIITDGKEDTENKLDNPWLSGTVDSNGRGELTTNAGSDGSEKAGNVLSTEAVAYKNIVTIAALKGTAGKSVIDVKTALATGLKAVASAYDDAVTALLSVTALKSTFVSSAAVTNSNYTGIESTAISAEWDSMETDGKLNSFDAISKAALACLNAGDAVTALDKGVGDFLKGLVSSDASYVAGGDDGASKDGYFLKNSASTFKKHVDELLEGLVAGTKTLSDVTSFVSEANLKAEYTSDVATAFSNLKSWMNDKYLAQYKVTSGTDEGLALKAKYEAFIALLGNKVIEDEEATCGYRLPKSAETANVDFTGTTYTSVKKIEEKFVEKITPEDQSK